MRPFHERQNETAFSRRSCRKPFASSGAEGSAREARKRRNRRRRLRTIEDREIIATIRKQEDVGLKSATDGEYRRAFWNYDFLGELDGVEAYLGERKIQFQGPQPKP